MEKNCTIFLNWRKCFKRSDQPSQTAQIAKSFFNYLNSFKGDLYLWISLKYFCTDIVFSWGFSVLEGLGSCYDLFFSWGWVLTSRSVSAPCTSTSVGGGSLFKISLKCSVHAASCSASVMSSRRCWSIIGASVPTIYLTHTSLMIL